MSQRSGRASSCILLRPVVCFAVVLTLHLRVCMVGLSSAAMLVPASCPAQMIRAGGTSSAKQLGQEMGFGFAAKLARGLGFVWVAQLTAALGGEFATIITSSLSGKSDHAA